MPLDLNNLLNSTPVSPPHSKTKQEGNQEETQIKKSEAIQFHLPTPVFNDRSNYKTKKQSYQRPTPITSFSYDERRDIQCGQHQYHSLRPLFLDKSHVGFDLNSGIDQAIFQDQTVDEGLDGLLISLFDLFQKLDPKERLDHARGLLSTKVITWRGLLTKLCSSVYESGNFVTGWTMKVMFVNGIMYIEEGTKQDITKDIKGNGRPTYYGYSYESLATNESFQNVNTNEQWVSVVKSKLNGIRMVMGGEVDAVKLNEFNKLKKLNLSTSPSHPLDPEHFIEIKTCINPVNEKDFSNLYRFKLLKFWLQSFLLGTPHIHVGLRDRNGVVCGVENYDTQDIPNLVRQFARPGNRWSSNLCLENATRIIETMLNKFKLDLNSKESEHNSFLNKNEKNSSRLNFFQDQLNSIIEEEFQYQRSLNKTPSIHQELSERCIEKLVSLTDWPIYELKFTPIHNNHQQQQNHSIEFIELDPIQKNYLNSKPNHFFNYSSARNHQYFSRRERVGFLPLFWLTHLVHLQVDLLFEKSLHI